VNDGCGCGTPTCVGDPMMRVCERRRRLHLRDQTSCRWTTSAACGPNTSFVCPASGVYTVLTGAFQAGNQFTCQVQTSTPTP
jgi:hypothetical protein